MKEAEPTPFIFEVFSSFFRVQVHSLLAWGIDVAQAKIRPDSKEEHITGYIAEAIKDRLLRQDPGWTQFYDVHNEDPIPSDERPGKERSPIDLLIVEVTGTGRPEYIFEAKQLNFTKKHQRTGNYTGSEAMGRFLAGEYANYTARFPEVGMLGYVLSDSAETWRDRLKAAIQSKRTELSLRHPQEDVRVVDAFPLEWTSEHDRKSTPRPITIYHILVPCIDNSGDP